MAKQAKKRTKRKINYAQQDAKYIAQGKEMGRYIEEIMKSQIERDKSGFMKNCDGMTRLLLAAEEYHRNPLVFSNDKKTSSS